MTQTRKNRNTHNKTKKKYTFTKNDYISGDGMQTNIWGPAAWHFIHTISFNYPVEPTQENKKHYREFVLNLKNVLPCKYCRINLANNFKKKPLQMCHMKSRETFSRYIYELHETVNKMLNKKSNLTYCDVRERYEHFRSRCSDEKPKVFTFKKSNTRRKKEKGCTEPLYGKKAKCIINIVPQENKSATFQMDKKCIKIRE
mgnify:FL=1|jgi:hypothetical protein